MKRLGYIFVLIALGPAAQAAQMSGKEVFDHYCTWCHGTSEGPGSMQLSRTRGKQQALLTERSDLTRSYIEYVVRHGLKSMPPFAPSDLDDAKLEALAVFLARK